MRHFSLSFLLSFFTVATFLGDVPPRLHPIPRKTPSGLFSPSAAQQSPSRIAFFSM